VYESVFGALMVLTVQADENGGGGAETFEIRDLLEMPSKSDDDAKNGDCAERTPKSGSCDAHASVSLVERVQRMTSREKVQVGYFS
jgi:hypothetical protein